MKAFNAIVVTVFVGVVGFITYSLMKDSDRKYYVTTHPKKETIEKKLNLSGFVYPGKEIEIKPQISGVVDAIYVSIGDKVKEGDPIASVNLVPNSSEVEQLTSNVNMARITLESVQLRYERQRQLYEAKAISRADFETVEQEYRTAQEQYSSAEYQLSLRKKGKRSGNNIVRSSTTGVVIDIPVKIGTSVVERSGYNPGSTVAVLAGTDHFLFKANVPERYIDQLNVGMPVVLTLLALDSLRIDATVLTISAKGEMQSGAVKFPIEAIFTYDGNDHVIRSGYSATGELLLHRAEEVLSLPENSICFKGDTSFVYLTDSLKHKVWENDVRLGISDGQKVEILSGVTPIDYVVTNYHD